MMPWEDIAKLVTAIIAWDAVCVQLFVLSFSRKPESLQKEYITAGVLDAALSYIETNKLIPTLASIFTRIREAQADRRRSLTEDEVEQLLQQIDYIGDLGKAQEAMVEMSSIKSLFDSLQTCARQISTWGLLHVVTTLALPVSLCLHARHSLPVLVGSSGFIIVTLVLAFVHYVSFHRRMKVFLNLLKHNRQEG